jgi:hypothetical protein
LNPSVASFLFFYFARAVFAILWIVWVCAALRRILASPRAAMRAASSWPAFLTRRGIIQKDDPSTHDALESLRKATSSVLRRSYRWAAVGALLGILAGGLCGAPLFFAPSTLPRDLPTMALALMATSLLRQIGADTGAVLGFTTVQKLLDITPQRSVAFDDRRSGRASDFRAPVLLLAPVALFLAGVVLTVLTIFGLLQPFTHWDVSSLYALATPITLLSLPIMTALAIILLEILEKRVAQAPQHTYSFSASPTREADFSLRAGSIGGLYRSEVTVAVNALLGQWVILVLMGASLADTTSLTIYIAIVVLWSFVLTLVARRITRTAGQLGGRLTGWWWQQRATAQAAG